MTDKNNSRYNQYRYVHETPPSSDMDDEHDDKEEKEELGTCIFFIHFPAYL